MITVDRQNYQPLLYQVATAAQSPADVAEPVRSMLRDQTNAIVIRDVAVISFDHRQGELTSGDMVP